MSEQNHTPGPWELIDGQITVTGAEPDESSMHLGCIMGPGAPGRIIAFLGQAGAPEYQLEADARLITAAPELLALAEMLVEYLTAPSNPEGAERDLLAVAQDAIRKAKGGDQ